MLPANPSRHFKSYIRYAGIKEHYTDFCTARPQIYYPSSYKERLPLQFRVCFFPHSQCLTHLNSLVRPDVSVLPFQGNSVQRTTLQHDDKHCSLIQVSFFSKIQFCAIFIHFLKDSLTSHTYIHKQKIFIRAPCSGPMGINNLM